MQKWKRSKLIRCALALVLGLACADSGAAGEKFVVVSHAPDSDTWWNIIRNAVKQAGEDFNVTVEYRNPAHGDLAEMARLIEQAAARNADGLVVSIADFSVLQKPLAQVVARKIPLVTINSGTTRQSEQLGALLHVGQSEYDAGLGAGVKAKAAGVKSFLCVNHYATNPESFERCRGFADALGVDFQAATLDTHGIDAAVVESKVATWLQRHPGTQGVLALGVDSAVPALRAMDKLGLKNKLWFATFDLSAEIIKGIKDGSVRFAIDQQPYLQGYIPVALMAIMKQGSISDLPNLKARLMSHPKFQARLAEYGLTPSYGARHISAGPGYVTRDNVGKVEKYAGQYR
ncbi:sugar ABC transporter substrate-binding protein [Oxalobacteraceae bacterium]|nr:sugar ABC transporter substrate-binding protein [Oxalobacteraceae bacterium]